jgi:hypothetical protein
VSINSQAVEPQLAHSDPLSIRDALESCPIENVGSRRSGGMDDDMLNGWENEDECLGSMCRYMQRDCNETNYKIKKRERGI